jgi:hypothetical protein
MKHRTFVLLTAAVSASFAASASADLSDVLGITNTDGKYFNTTKDYMDEGADEILQTGSKTIKLEMNHYTNTKYQWNSTWPSSFTNLKQMAQLNYFQSVFSKPFSTYILTANAPNIGSYEYYWVKGTAEGSGGATIANCAAETQQFYDVTKYLMQTYKGTGKTFVFSHWEGDYAMRTNSATHPNGPFDVTSPPTQNEIDGMIAWLNAREAGIVKARNEIMAADPSNNVKVYGATEAAAGSLALGQKGAGSLSAGVINSVLPNTNVDLLEYSAWDTQKVTSGTYSFSNTLDYMINKMPATAVAGKTGQSVIIGEYGTKENLEGTPQVTATLNNVLNNVASKNIRNAVYWEVNDNEIKSGSTAVAPNVTNADMNGLWMVKPDGSASTAWHQYRGRIADSDPTRATTNGFTNSLTNVYTDSFTANTSNLGSNWTTSNWGGAISISQSAGLLQMKILNGTSTPWGEARLSLTNTIGRGIKPGEYAEFKLRRQNTTGGIGIGLFGDASGTVHAGAGSGSTASALQIWNGSAWSAFSFATDGSHPTTTWDTSHTLGVRLDSADGSFAAVSYYLDGAYTGSWLYKTAATTLDTIALFAQSGTANAGFEFDNLKVYANALMGDTNLDGTVNAADFTALSQHFNGTSAVWMNGDFNNDGVVNALDFNTLANNFGRKMTAPTLGEVVPEPSICLGLIVVSSLASRSRRRQISNI